MSLKNSAKKIQDVLDQFKIDAKVIEFKELTRTSEEAAKAIGCAVGQIAKTLIFKGKNSGKPICVVASGVNRIDEKKIANSLGESIERPDADFVLKHTGFAIGGIPPVGFTFETPFFIDEDLMGYEELWAAAGTPNAVFKLAPKDLLKITQGTLLNVKK